MRNNTKRILLFSVFLIMVGVGLMVSGTTALGQINQSVGTISGVVKDVKGGGVKGAIVSAEGQSVEAITVADGSFKLSGVVPGPVFLSVKSPSIAYLNGGLLKSIALKGGDAVSGIVITLSGRPGDKAEFVGISSCAGCHDDRLLNAFDGSPNASVHSRFITEGTNSMVYKDMWPKSGDKYLPRDPKGTLLMVQDPLDAKGLVHVVLCTKGDEPKRQYLFKFYPEKPEGVFLKDSELDCSDKPADAVWIPVAATNGGQGNWGEGYVDPEHKVPDRRPNFGEGKQRYMCRVEDVPYLVKFMKENNIQITGKQDYLAFMPVYIMQDGTPVGSKFLKKGEVGAPMFWQKSAKKWVSIDSTLSRNCAGCHATGVTLKLQDVNDYKGIVTHWDYKDLNITCERCHGPGSEHAATGDKSKIIAPRYLTAKAGNELCGQCHASHDGKSKNPMGIFKPPFDSAYIESMGNGFFVPGLHDLETFYLNLCQPSPWLEANWKEGSFHTWQDQKHGRAHSMELCESNLSAHNSNSREKLTCASCHDAHTLDAGPVSLVVDGYDFENAAYANNTLCLSCHAGRGQFEDVTIADVATLQLDAGRRVKKGDAAVVVEEKDAALSRNKVARAVGKHMQVEAGMGVALYTPANIDMPVGNCASCHMAKIGKLQDVGFDNQYHLDLDQDGRSAIAEGNVASHVFDIVWPGQSAILRSPDLTKGKDIDIMPNSCGKCHVSARISGDLD